MSPSASSAAQISVVIPIRNAGPSFQHTLRALASLTPRPGEVLLVDNGSTDGSERRIRDFATGAMPFPVQALLETRPGASAARNAGIRVARGDVIAFTDADCAPAPDWLRHLSEPFLDPKIGGVAGRVVAAPPASTVELFSALYTLQLAERPARHGWWTPWEGGYPTANLAVRRCLLEELGGFDEGVGIYGEDYDLCARLYARGYEIVYVPDARVAHHHRTAVPGMLRQAFGFGRSHGYLFRRHAREGLWIQLPRHPIVWRRSPIRGWLDLASADKKMLAMLLLGAGYSPALVLLPLYTAWLALAAARRAKAAGRPVSPASAVALAALLLLKSAAMTAGRWWGSVKYGALCL